MPIIDDDEYEDEKADEGEGKRPRKLRDEARLLAAQDLLDVMRKAWGGDKANYEDFDEAMCDYLRASGFARKE